MRKPDRVCKLLITLSPVAWSLILVGCSMMPDYHRPATPVSDRWPDSVKSSMAKQPLNASQSAVDKTQSDITHLGWKNYFPDKRLQALIVAALENNRDLRIATTRIDEARALYGIQHADFSPTINLNATNTTSRTPQTVFNFGNNQILRRNDLNVGFVSYELDFWGRVRSLNAFAKASYLATEEAQRAFLFSLVADVANTYLSLVELRERTELTRSTVSARAKSKILISRRRESGVSGELEYLQAEGSYQSALAELANLERQQAAAENLLTLLVGQSITEIKNLPVGRSLSKQGITPAMLAGLPAEILLQRPDVIAAEQRLIAANANIGAARAAFFPRIALTGNIGVASRDLGGLFDSGSSAWSFQPIISLPLFTGGRGTANLNLAEARKVIAIAEYEKTIQLAFREVADLLNASETFTRQLSAQAANAAAQKQRLRLVEARFSAGVANYLEVLDAQREAYSAEQGEVQVRRSWLSVATQLFKALAGNNVVSTEKVER